MKALKILILLAFASHAGISQAVGYDQYTDEYQGFDSGAFHLTLLNRGEGLLETSDVSLGTILSSHHFSNQEDYNETHNGVYLSVDQWSVGSYRNSGDVHSTFVTYNSEVYRNRQIEVELVLGVADGYEGWKVASNGYMPIVGFSTRWTYFKTMMSYDVVAFGLEMPLN